MPMQGNPCTVRVMLLHQILPHPHWHRVSTLFVPGDLLHLEPSVRCSVKNCSAEKEKKRNFSIFQGVEILGGRDVEVIGALNRQHCLRRLCERTDSCVRVTPKTVTKSLSPAVRGAEKIDQFLPFLVIVRAVCRLDLNLGLKNYRLNQFCFRRICHLQMKMKEGDQSSSGWFHSGHSEIEVRHRFTPSALLIRGSIPSEAGKRTSRFLPRRGLRRPSPSSARE